MYRRTLCLMRSTMTVFLSALFILSVTACTSLPFSKPAATSLTPPNQTEEEYGLQPGDVIRVSVWREEALDQGVLVRPDGGISFPLAGDVNVEGATIEDVTDTIAGKLSKFIPNPVVTVSLQENAGNRIYVTGRVNQPGVFLINRPVDVMQALAMAGGPTPFADKTAIKVLRRKGTAQTSIPFNYKQVQKGEALQQNIMLQAGDTLVVP